MTEPPFDPKDVLFRYTPTEEEKERYFFDREYVILKDLHSGSGLTHLALDEGNEEWFLPSPQPLFFRLLAERATLTAQLAMAEAALEKYANEELWDPADGIHELLWAGNTPHGYTSARAALEQIKKGKP